MGTRRGTLLGGQTENVLISDMDYVGPTNRIPSNNHALTNYTDIALSVCSLGLGRDWTLDPLELRLNIFHVLFISNLD